MVLPPNAPHPRKRPLRSWCPSALCSLWRCLLGGVVAAGCLGTALGAEVDLTPISTADGLYTQVTVAGQPVWQNTGAASYLYGRRPNSFNFTVGQTLYVRATYYDDAGGGKLSLQYDSQTAAYTTSALHTRTSRVGSGQFVDGYFELPNVLFNKRQNGSSDFRLTCGAPGGVAVSVQRITLSDTPFADADFQLVISRPWQSRYTGPAKDYVDATTLKGKSMAGYQGWFRTPNDLADNGWGHWVRNNTMIAENFTIDMWPDLTEYDPATLDRAGSVMTRGGAPAYLFSSTSYAAVQRHFRWMRKHNIDGAFVQRFHPQAGAAPEWVLRNVSQAAAEEGLIWAVEYDVSGMADATVAAKLQADWEWLTTQFDILNDPRYAREGSKPVVFIWGFPFPDRNFTTPNADAAVDYFKAQGAYVIGGIPNTWSSLSAAWQTHIAKYDGVLVWQNQSTSNGAFFRGRGQDFYPHIWPGFSWANLKQQPATPPIEYTDRNGGQYYWTKGRDWINGGGADRLFIGMFDEYDEATAIMPMTDDPPNPSASYGRFLDNQGKPSDWWMMLTDELKRMMWGQRTNTNTLPTVASLANRSNIGAEASVDLGTTDLVSSLSRVAEADGNTIVETVGGKECRGNTTPATDRYLYFNVSNAFAHQLANGDVTIEVEYYDTTGSTVLGLQYDGASGAYQNHPQSITTTGSNMWRTVRFEISDAYFDGRQNGSSDFRLNFNGKKLNVNRVWVRLPEGKSFPFTWTNAAAGPALNWSQNANWLGGIVAPSDLTSTVRFFPGQTMPGGTIPIVNNTAGGQELRLLQLSGTASSSAATTVTLSGNAISLGGSAPVIALDATRSAFDFTYDIAAPLMLLGTTQIGGDGDAGFRISGAISGSGGLTKTGNATLTLTGANTFSGATNLNAGTLAVNGSHASPVTVASPGTLAGEGTLSGATTVNGRHSPGDTAVAILTHSGTLSYGATSRVVWQLNSHVASGGSGTAYDGVAAQSVTVAAGAATDITLNATGSVVNLTDPFWDTARSWNIVTHTSRTGTFALGTVTADPGGRSHTNYGTFALNHTATAVALTWTPYTAQQNWRLQYFGTIANTGNAADLADANNDGEVNLYEFATAQNPSATTRATPTVARNGATLDFTYTRSLAAMSDGVTFTVEWSDTLAAGSWSSAGVTEQILSDSGTVQVVKASVAAGTGATRFLHLKATKP